MLSRIPIRRIVLADIHHPDSCTCKLCRQATASGLVPESQDGKFTHVEPLNAPRHDLRKMKTLPDPDLSMDDPDLSLS